MIISLKKKVNKKKRALQKLSLENKVQKRKFILKNIQSQSKKVNQRKN
jgi:hypothetical protein